MSATQPDLSLYARYNDSQRYSFSATLPNKTYMMLIFSVSRIFASVDACENVTVITWPLPWWTALAVTLLSSHSASTMASSYRHSVKRTISSRWLWRATDDHFVSLSIVGNNTLAIDRPITVWKRREVFQKSLKTTTFLPDDVGHWR